MTSKEKSKERKNQKSLEYYYAHKDDEGFKEKSRKYQKEYYRKNKEKAHEYQKEYYYKNREKERERKRKYYLENRDKIIQKVKENNLKKLFDF